MEQLEQSLDNLNLQEPIAIADQSPIVHLPFLIIPVENQVRGQLQTMIDNKQLQWRLIQNYQQEPYQPISKYFRNIDYKDQNTRSVDALVKTLSYIHQNHVPKIAQLFQYKPKDSGNQQDSNKSEKSSQTNKNKDTKGERQMILTFIEQRIKAIRTQYYVQGISYPQQLIKIIRLTFIIEVLREVAVTTEGLKQLIKNFTDKQFDLGQDWQQYTKNDRIKRRREQLKVFRERYKHVYIEALQYSIILASMNELHALLNDHQIIMEDPVLKDTLKLIRAINNKNFQKYQRNLQKHQNPIIQCLLWNRIDQMQEQMVERIANSKMKVKKGWFYKFMGWHIKKEESDQWIQGKTAYELSSNQEAIKRMKLVNIGVKNWVSIQNLVKWISKKAQQKVIIQVSD